MKRREFITKFGLLAGGLGTAIRGYAATPCQPPSLSAVGGTTGAARACPAEGETLQEVAAALTPGQFGSMPLSAQNPLTRHNPEISWQTICWYDETRKEIQYMGAPQSNVSTDHQHYIFDELSNTWRTTGQSLFPSTGHIWSSAFDPATGDYFFKRMTTSDNTIRWMRRSVEAGAGTGNNPWSRTAGTSELSDGPGQKCGMAWHPNLFGTGDGGIAVFSNDRVVGWRKSTNSWSDIWVFGSSTAYSDLRNGSGNYIPERDEVVLGTGVGANTLVYVTAGSGGSPGTAGVRGTTPIPIAGRDSAGSGAILLHPSDGNRILLMEGANGTRVWDSNDGGANWSNTGWSHPFGNMPGANASNNVKCTVSPYGVIAGLTSRTNLTVTPTFRVWMPPN